jgi:type VI secretion system protein VasJ
MMEMTGIDMAWCTPYLTPLAKDLAGENPIYHEDFETIKAELEKISGCNYSLIENKAISLLTEVSKDLRVAGYLCLALTANEKRKGLIKGLSLFLQLILNFGDNIHPKSENARIAAIAWLNHSKILYFLEQADSVDDESLEQLRALVNHFNTTTQAFSNGKAPRFDLLNKWLKEVSNNIKKPSEEKQENNKTTKETTILPLIDEVSADKSLSNLIKFWQNEGDKLYACQLARTLRWSHLSLPNHINGRTNIPQPRKEAIQSLEQFIAENNHQEVLAHCEMLFLESSGHFYLDIQWHAFQAAKALGEEKLASYIYQQTFWLSSNLPELRTLKFSEGLAFASDACQQWLLPAEEVNKTKDIKTAEAYLLEAKNNAKNDSLKTILQVLSFREGSNTHEKLNLLLAKARACKQAKDYDSALVYYKELTSFMNQTKFLLWHKKEATEIYEEILAFVHSKQSQLLSTAAEQDFIYDLKRKLCMCF